MKTLEHSHILVTGASSGLGKALALELAKEHATVFLIARSQEKLAEVQQEIEQAGGKAFSYVCDVSEKNQVSETIQAILKDHSTIDILVNNAGIWHKGLIEQDSEEDVEKVFGVNTFGAFHFLQQLLPYFKQKNAGEILNIVSKAAFAPREQYGVYAASKAALHSLTQSVTAELAGTNIKIMGIYPGMMDVPTFFNRKSDANYEQGLEPEDVAKIAVFMLKQPEDLVIERLDVREVSDTKDVR